MGCACAFGCSRCDARLHGLEGPARARGLLWAEFVAKAVSDDRPWPEFTGRAADIARRRVANLANDPEVMELLARLCHREAARWWTHRKRRSR